MYQKIDLNQFVRFDQSVRPYILLTVVLSKGPKGE